MTREHQQPQKSWKKDKT